MACWISWRKSAGFSRADGKNLPGGGHQQQGFLVRGQELDRAKVRVAAQAQQRAGQAEERHGEGPGHGRKRAHPFDIRDRDLLDAQTPGKGQLVAVEAVIGAHQGVQAIDQDGDGDEDQDGQHDQADKEQAERLPVGQHRQGNRRWRPAPGSEEYGDCCPRRRGGGKSAGVHDLGRACNTARMAWQTCSTMPSVITLEKGMASPRMPRSSVTGKSPRR